MSRKVIYNTAPFLRKIKPSFQTERMQRAGKLICELDSEFYSIIIYLPEVKRKTLFEKAATFHSIHLAWDGQSATSFLWTPHLPSRIIAPLHSSLPHDRISESFRLLRDEWTSFHIFDKKMVIEIHPTLIRLSESKKNRLRQAEDKTGPLRCNDPGNNKLMI